MRWGYDGRREGHFRFARRMIRSKDAFMTAAELDHSASNEPNPPNGLDATALALWHARAGNWERAHDLCQEIPGTAGSWIHAYLHREEGDLSNAAYWYARAGRGMPDKRVSIAEEWREIAKALLG